MRIVWITSATLYEREGKIESENATARYFRRFLRCGDIDSGAIL